MLEVDGPLILALHEDHLARAHQKPLSASETVEAVQYRRKPSELGIRHLQRL